MAGSPLAILSVVGARPQFIKAALVSRELEAAGHHEVLIHTGQHYSTTMSDVFFEELNIPEPRFNLRIGSHTHGRQVGHIMIALEDVWDAGRLEPDFLLVYGDTNSTLAGALVGVKRHIVVVHVEAGLRSFNWKMPEEHNRRLTDHCSSLLFCPTDLAVRNLAAEGIVDGVHNVGDVMYDLLLEHKFCTTGVAPLTEIGVTPQGYRLVTIHREENTDNPRRLVELCDRVMETRNPIVWPVHPRLEGLLPAYVKHDRGIKLIEPLPYKRMLTLIRHARDVMTDSGGVQREAHWLGVPCTVLREETEWDEMPAIPSRSAAQQIVFTMEEWWKAKYQELPI